MKLDYDGANVARATPAGTGDDNHRLRRAIAMYQLFGGSFGLQVVWRLFGQVGRLGFWIPFLTLVIFAGTASAGILLWRDHHHAETLTAFAQMVQVPIVLSSSVGYYCIAGLGLQLKWDTAWNVGFYVHIGALFHLAWAGDSTTTILGVNVVPLAILCWLLRLPEPRPGRSVPAGVV